MDPKLLEILVCPVTKGPLTYDREKQEAEPCFFPQLTKAAKVLNTDHGEKLGRSRKHRSVLPL